MHSGQDQQCIKDVLNIANNSEDFEQAKTRVQQLFAEGRSREYLAVAQRVRDQLDRRYSADAQVCLDQIVNWLDREHLTGRQQAG